MIERPKLTRPRYKMDRIAFAGPMCVGKTSLANVLVDNAGYSKASFAEKLKGIAYSLYGEIEKNNEGRKLLQELADDLKKWDSELFVKHLLLRVQNLEKNGYHKIVVDDLRFPSEEVALRKAGFFIVGVTCNEDVRRERIMRLYPDTDPAREQHLSERGWTIMEFDYTIDSTDKIAFYDVMAMIDNAPKNSIRRKK